MAQRLAQQTLPAKGARAAALGRVGAAVVTAALVQTALVSQVRVGGACPDVLLLLALGAGAAAGPEKGALVGFFAGLAYDVHLQTPLGLSALVYALAAYGVGLAQLPFSRHARWLASLTIGLGSAAAVGAFLAVGLVLGQSQLLDAPVAAAVLVVGAVNAVLAPPARRFAEWVLR
ncbi:MAG: rod shape-determining protein MreD [Acidimicrobiales bacterium]